MQKKLFTDKSETCRSKRLGLFFENNLNKNIKWVFFDWFDTLAERNCHPETIKMLWAVQISRMCKGNPEASLLYKIRKESEAFLSEKYGGIIRIEISYPDLMKEIYKRICMISEREIKEFWLTAENFTEQAKRIELEIEVEKQRQKIENCNILKMLSKQGIRIAVVSDFYLGSDAYVYFAEKLKLSEYIDEYFVSSDWGERKENGKLYSIVLDNIGIFPDECLMVGDNLVSDYRIPIEKGIRAVKLRRSPEKILKDRKKIQKDLLKVFRMNRQIYGGYAFSLYYFVAGLYRELVTLEKADIFFLAREGEFIKELFDMYIEINHLPSIESKYIYISRLASFVPTLRELEEENFEVLFRQSKNLSLSSFLKNTGFKKEEAEEILVDELKDPYVIIENFPESREFNELKNNEKFKIYYNKNRKEQRKNFICYLENIRKQENDSIVVVDVGWKGTIQDNIACVFQEGLSVGGIYLGLSKDLQKGKNCWKKGINFSVYPLKTGGYDIFSYDKSFYEKILYASHAATVSYEKSEGRVTPVLENFKEEEETYAYVRPYQEMLKQIFQGINSCFLDTCYVPFDLERVFRKIHLKTVCLIGRKNLDMQNYLVNKHIQNFGELSWNQGQIAGIIKKIALYEKRNVIKKIKEDLFSISYMYSAVKVLASLHLSFIIPCFTRIVYIKEVRKIDKDE